MMELWLNNLLADTSGVEDIVATFAINNLLDVSSRSGTYSNTFQLPKTNANKLIFGTPNDLLSNTYIPYQRIEMRIVVNGLPIVVGYAILTNASKTFEVSVFGNNADWFDRAKELNLEDFIDLVELNHFWTEANVLANRANLWADGFIYPNIDYGDWETLATYDVPYYQFFVSVYQKFVFKKIFSTLGLTIVSDFITNVTEIENQILPFSGKWKRDKRYNYRWYVKGTYPSFTWTNFSDVPVYPTINASSDYNHLIDVAGFSVWAILDPITITYKISGMLTAPPGGSTMYLRADRYERNTNIFVDQILLETISVPAGTNAFEQTFKLSGDYINYLRFDTLAASLNLDTDWTIEAISYEEFEVDNLDEYLEIVSEDDCEYADTYNYIAVSGTLANVKVMDFLKTFTNKYCLMYDSNVGAGFARVFPLKDVINNIPFAEDWSDKLDKSFDPEITFQPEGYFQTNIFKYAGDDSDYLIKAAPLSGQGQFEINDKNLENEGIVFESVYALVLRRNSFTGTIADKRMAYIPKMVDGEPNDCTPRMAEVRFDSDHNITISGNPEEPMQPAVYFSETFNLKLLPTYYPPLIDITSLFKLMRVPLNLTPADIHNLDYRLPKYFSQFNCYFYLNEIEQFKFTKKEITWTQLIKIG